MSKIIDFIINHYPIILIILAALAIIILILKNIHKKRNDKDEVEKTLALKKEIKNLKNTKYLAKYFVIARRNIQDYYAYLYDENGCLILISEMCSSIVSIKSLIVKIKNALLNQTFGYSHTMDNKIVGLLYNNKRLIAKTNYFTDEKEFINYIEEFRKYSDSMVYPDVVKDDSIILFESLVNVKEKKQKNNWKFDTLGNNYLIKLFNENKELIFQSLEIFDKKEAKKMVDYIYDSIKLKYFVVEYDINTNTYHYILRGKGNETIAIGLDRATLEESFNDIENIIVYA